jgi:hypothetical protein
LEQAIVSEDFGSSSQGGVHYASRQLVPHDLLDDIKRAKIFSLA